MDNETDRTIRDLFAEPYGEQGPDEVFVAGVLRRVRRRSRLRSVMSGAVAALFVSVIVFAVPVVTDSTSVVASLPFLAIEPFQELLVSPAGLLASLPIGILVLALSTLRLREL